MPKLKFDDRTIRALGSPERGQINYIDATLPGFSLRLAAGGARTWTVTYHRRRHVRRVTRSPLPGRELRETSPDRAAPLTGLCAVANSLQPAARRIFRSARPGSGDGCVWQRSQQGSAHPVRASER